MTRDVMLEMTQIEALHLAGLVTQFVELLDESGHHGHSAPGRSAPGAPDDPAVRRLVPDAYADADSARDFRDVTEADLLSRRRADATAVLAALPDPAPLGDGMDESDALVQISLHIDGDMLPAWLRTLAAIRLVLATRLGIADVDDHDGSDPRFGIYDWLGYRLDGLVRALDDD